ncbi:hypothetical protein K3727_21840 (plasmid) [Rhodobacteraceae bacterium M382]|nr:hypothetical protein K3727_21840 [Rhodobacteraceae bacterium M382]
MTFQDTSFRHLFQASDGTWVLPVDAGAFNGFSAVVPAPFGMAPVLDTGSLLRVQSNTNSPLPEVLWRVVARVAPASDAGSQVASLVLVPTDVPANVPAPSVKRVEEAVLGKPAQSALAA